MSRLEQIEKYYIKKEKHIKLLEIKVSKYSVPYKTLRKQVI